MAPGTLHLGPPTVSAPPSMAAYVRTTRTETGVLAFFRTLKSSMKSCVVLQDLSVCHTFNTATDVSKTESKAHLHCEHQ